MADPTTMMVYVGDWSRARGLRIHADKLELLVQWGTDPGNGRETALQATLAGSTGWRFEEQDGNRWLVLDLPTPAPEKPLDWLYGRIGMDVVAAR